MLSRDDIFNELGIGPVWRLRDAPGGSPHAPVSVPIQNWEQLADVVAHCTACKLHTSRTQSVLGVGDRNADWLIIGEAPGVEEEEQGEPFVGQAGQLLDAMLGAIGLARGNNVYITNVLKSHPPGNRDPEPDELTACRPYLQAQIELIQPKIILALGHVAAQSLLDSKETIGHLRGRVHQFQGVPLVATYHPAYLLRKPTEKARAWEDLCLARRLLQSPPALNLKTAVDRL